MPSFIHSNINCLLKQPKLKFFEAKITLKANNIHFHCLCAHHQGTNNDDGNENE